MEKLNGISAKYQAYTIIFDNAPYIVPRINKIETEVVSRATCKGVNRAGINVRIGTSSDYIGCNDNW
jgi:hypothetical protein